MSMQKSEGQVDEIKNTRKHKMMCSKIKVKIFVVYISNDSKSKEDGTDLQ